MGLMMIASIVDKKKTIGIRLIDTRTLKGNKAEYKDVPVESIVAVLNKEPDTIDNLSLLNGELVGSNGVMDRYAKLNMNNRILLGDSPMVILNSIGEVGYTVCDYNGNVRKWSNADTFEYANTYGKGIANGKAVEKDGNQFISSIVGNYEVVKVPKSKAGVNSGAGIGILINTNASARSVAKNARVDINREVRETDVFKTMTSEQKKVIQAYYVWYTVDIFKNLAKGLRLNVPEDKVETMAELRGERDWRFGGITDLGFLGGGTCELGHALRYAYKAYPIMKDGQPGQPIIFGETCSSDFFNISPEDMKHLVKARTIMSDEIKTMSEISANELHELYFNKTPLLNEWLGVTDNVTIMKILGKKIGGTLLAFKLCGMPYPESLVKTVSIELEKNYKQVLELICPGHNITELGNILSSGSYYTSEITELVQKYCKFMLYVKFRGEYGYDPIAGTGKEKGLRFNADTRKSRSMLLRNFTNYFKCEKYDLAEFRDVLTFEKKMVPIREIIYKAVGEDRRYYVSFDVGKTHILMSSLNDIVLKRPNPLEEYADNANIVLASIGYFRRRGFGSFRDVYIEPGMRSDVISLRFVVDKLESDAGDIVKIDRLVSELMGEAEEREKAAEKARLAEEEIQLELKLAREKEEAEEKARIAGEKAKLAEEEVSKALEKSEEQVKEKVDGVKKMERLALLLDKYGKEPEVIKDYSCNIAKDIVERGLDYSRLSSRQKYRVDEALENLELLEKGESIESVFTESSEEGKTADKTDDNKDLMEKIEKILNVNDAELLEQINKASRIAISVAQTVQKRGSASKKQMYHIDLAIDTIDEYEEF